MEKISKKSKAIKAAAIGTAAATLLAGGIKEYQNQISNADISLDLNVANEPVIEQTITLPSNTAFAANVDDLVVFNSPENVRLSSIKDKFKEASEEESERDIENSESQASEQESEDIPEQNEGEQITDELDTEIDKTTNEIDNYPDAIERTTLADSWYRGSVDEIWKISGMIGLGALLGATAVVAGTIIGTNKNRRNRAFKNDAKYFVGPEYIKTLNSLSSISKEIDDIKTKIKNLTVKSKRGSTISRQKSLNQATELAKSSKYLALKNLKKQLVLEVNQIVKNNVETTDKKLEFLRKYVKASKKIIKSPEINHIKLSKNLSRQIKKCSKSETSFPRQALIKFLSNLGANLSTDKKSKRENKLNIILKSSQLTGFNRVLLSNILNNQSNISEGKLDDVKNLAIYLRSAEGNYKKQKSLLYNWIKATQLNDKNKTKQAEKYRNKFIKIQKQLKESDPRPDLKYYGEINQIKQDDIKIPINPVRFLSSTVLTNELKTFFDKVFCSHIGKGTKIHEVTVSYKVDGKPNCFCCSFDNKEAANLMGLKFISSLPENATEVNIIERNQLFSDKDQKATRTNVSALPAEEYKSFIKDCKRNVDEFEAFIASKPAVVAPKGPRESFSTRMENRRQNRVDRDISAAMEGGL